MNLYLFILFLIFLFFFIKEYLIKEFFYENNIKIFNKDELKNILINNNDNYYNNFNKYDLDVRGVNTIEQYKNKIKNSPITINNNDILLIKKKIIKVDNFLINYNFDGFDGLKASKIKWNIGIINDKFYEEEFPHTRKDIIIISYKNINNDLDNILIHEKIHIYQKMYPEDIKIYLDKYNFKIYEKRSNYNNIRSNPDIDEYIYLNNNNEKMYCLYNNNPTSIIDVTCYPNNNYSYEHPFEFMAYSIEDNYIKNK